MEVTNETHMQYAVVHPRTISNVIRRKDEKVFYVMHLILNQYV